MIRVLAAEDDPLAQRAIRGYLAPVPDIEVLDIAGDGAKALALVESLHPDVLITDLHMPGGDGVEMIGRIRAAEKSAGMKRMPVLVLTADRRKPVVQKARLSGADGVIDKPAAAAMA